MRRVNTIGEYFKYKILNLRSKMERRKQEKFYQWWEEIVVKMVNVGMFYFTKRKIHELEDIITNESNCFFNLLEILRLLFPTSKQKYIMEKYNKKILDYIYLRHSWDNFSKLCLKKADLRGANLSYVNLSDTNLSEAILIGAYLINANLEGANLNRAHLSEASLRGANLKGADLREASLRGTHLLNADLSYADLREADLRDSVIDGMIFNNLDLRGTIIDENQVNYLKGKCDLQDVKVYLKSNKEIVNFDEYSRRK